MSLDLQVVLNYKSKRLFSRLCMVAKIWVTFTREILPCREFIVYGRGKCTPLRHDVNMARL